MCTYRPLFYNLSQILHESCILFLGDDLGSSTRIRRTACAPFGVFFSFKKVLQQIGRQISLQTFPKSFRG
jgi:hypothetical protein